MTHAADLDLLTATGNRPAGTEYTGLAGAGLAVGLSFAIALAWDVRVLPAGPSAPRPASSSVPRGARLGLRVPRLV